MPILILSSILLMLQFFHARQSCFPPHNGRYFLSVKSVSSMGPLFSGIVSLFSGIVSLFFRDCFSFFRDCFLAYITHKFRSCIGKHKGAVGAGDEVLVCLSGGEASSAMLHLIDEGVKLTSLKKLRIKPSFLHVDGKFGTIAPKTEIFRNIFFDDPLGLVWKQASTLFL